MPVTLNNLLVEFYINAKLIQVTVGPETTALKLIREQLNLTGTKEPCNEGDCGGCTIALGSWRNGTFSYRAINSCILPASRLHGCHVITVEGLVIDKKLHLIQQVLLEQHAVQCGFCTAGFIMSIFCLLLNEATPNSADITNSLSGNLCRCTGYQFINDAVLILVNKLRNNKKLISDLLPTYAKQVQKELKKVATIKQVPTKAHQLDICKNYYIPYDLLEMFNLMNKFKGKFNIINGGTDLIAIGNMHDIWPEHFIDISQISQLNFIHGRKNKIIIGGTVTFGQLQASTLIKNKLPTLSKAILQMASNQVRNVATLAGNIVNASPIADSVCVLMALGATLIIKSKTGEHRIKLEDFYRDYKITKLNKNSEIVFAIEIPMESNFCDFIKTAKRTTLDIATVNSCLNLKIVANTIKSCRLAFGGVDKFPALAKEVNAFLIGKKVTEENIITAAKLAMKEFTPISDVRGSAEYRSLLIQHHLIKYFEKITRC